MGSMGSGGSAETTSKLCTDSTGRYCAEDPDGSGPVSGKEVIEEDLRQLCLHEQTKVRGRGSEFQDHVMPPEFAAAYWSYIEKFADSCPLDGDSKTGKVYGTECSYALMREVGLSEDDIRNIGECADPYRNTRELEKQKNHTAWSPRALRINGWRYSGIMDAELVATAVCAGFSKEPQECSLVKYANRDLFRPYLPTFQRTRGISFGTLIFWLLATVALVAGAFFLYKQYLNKEMRATIREEVMLEVESA